MMHESVKVKSKTEKNSYKRTEFKYGKFSRTVYFPEEIDIDNTAAKMENGILQIEAPKKHTEKEEKRKLTIS